MYIISERINGMFTAVRKAIAGRDAEAIGKIARRQLSAGADALDLNVGTAADDPAETLSWLAKTVRAVTDQPLCLDHPNFEVVRKAAETAGGDLIINSTTGKEEDLEKFLPLAAETGAGLIALTLDEKGVPNSTDGRVEIAARILIAAEAAGLPSDRLFIDPVILPINVAQNQPKKILEAISQFKLICDPPPRVVMGLSNLASGAGEKTLLTGAFLAMAMGAGLDAAILDPEDKLLMDLMITGEVLLNRVVYNRDYLKAWRSGRG